MRIVLLVLSLIYIIGSVLPFLRLRHWFFKGFEFLRIQYTVLGLILLIAFNWVIWDVLVIFLFVGLTISWAYQCWKIFPYLSIARQQTSDCASASPKIRILSSNVLQTNPNKDALVNLIRQCTPDLVLILESDLEWEAALDELSDSYPFQVKVPKDNYYGMHLYARYPLKHTKVHYLVSEDFPSIEACVDLGDGESFVFWGVHPPPPSPTESATSLERDGELMLLGRRIGEIDEPIIVAGDLNDVAWSPTTRLFKRLSGLLDPRIGRGLYPTFHADYWLLRMPIDHLFHSRHFCVQKVKRLVVLGSDHFALYYELGLKKKRTNPIHKEPLKQSERQEVAQILKDVRTEE